LGEGQPQLPVGQLGKLRAGCFTGASGALANPPQDAILPHNPVHGAFPQKWLCTPVTVDEDTSAC
jgi:hypothetical protein